MEPEKVSPLGVGSSTICSPLVTNALRTREAVRIAPATRSPAVAPTSAVPSGTWNRWSAPSQRKKSQAIPEGTGASQIPPAMAPVSSSTWARPVEMRDVDRVEDDVQRWLRLNRSLEARGHLLVAADVDRTAFRPAASAVPGVQHPSWIGRREGRRHSRNAGHAPLPPPKMSTIAAAPHP